MLTSTALLDLAIQEAMSFAVAAHRDQRYGRDPYRTHLDEVLSLAREYGLAPTALVAAPLHDVLEDTATGRSDIALQFGEPVADQVWSVTGVGATRAKRRASIIAKLVHRPDHAPLKLVDTLANVLRSVAERDDRMLQMYRVGMPDYGPVFARAHPAAHARLRALLG